MSDKISGLLKRNESVNKLVIESLSEGLIQLLKIKEFEKISITELCEKAGVSRMAFYNNFQTKEELLTHIMIDLMNILYNAVGSYYFTTESYNWYLKLFTELDQKEERLKIIFSAGLKHKFFPLINDLVLNINYSSNWEKYKRLMWAGAIVNTIIYWIDNGKKESIEQIAQFCYKNALK